MTDDKHQPTGQPAIRCLAARWVIPISQPPIHGGWVQIDGDKIVDVGADKPPSSVQDLGDVALLPKLINAHTHLEFSDCDAPIGEPGILLSDWIGAVVTARDKKTAAQKASAIQRGMRESRQAGVTLIGEITTPPCELPIEGPQVCERVAAAARHLARYPDAGISPHAPYSTSRPTIQGSVDLAIRRRRAVAMHVAESPAERELLAAGSGDFATALQDLGVWESGLFPWPGDPIVDLIEQLSAAPRALIIHGNDLTGKEIDRLARHPQMTVVYCPRTHAFVGYDRHPVDRLLAGGVRIALGTDSRASNPDLSIWREVQYLLRHRTDLDPDAVLAMATISGADALGKPEWGQIACGATAAFGVVQTAAKSTDQLYTDLAENDYRLPLPPAAVS